MEESRPIRIRFKRASCTLQQPSKTQGRVTSRFGRYLRILTSHQEFQEKLPARIRNDVRKTRFFEESSKLFGSHAASAALAYTSAASSSTGRGTRTMQKRTS